MKLWSRFQHMLGWNMGKVQTWWCGPVLMVGLRCECGDMHHVHETRIRRIVVVS